MAKNLEFERDVLPVREGLSMIYLLSLWMLALLLTFNREKMGARQRSPFHPS
jgi:hypothetical protein